MKRPSVAVAPPGGQTAALHAPETPSNERMPFMRAVERMISS